MRHGIQTVFFIEHDCHNKSNVTCYYYKSLVHQSGYSQITCDVVILLLFLFTKHWHSVATFFSTHLDSVLQFIAIIPVCVI